MWYNAPIKAARGLGGANASGLHDVMLVFLFLHTIAVRSSYMHATLILQHLKKHGQLVDWEIASAMDITLANVRDSLIQLSARGDISQCTVIRFLDGKPIEGILCRVAGTIPPKAPGRKPNA